MAVFFKNEESEKVKIEQGLVHSDAIYVLVEGGDVYRLDAEDGDQLINRVSTKPENPSEPDFWQTGAGKLALLSRTIGEPVWQFWAPQLKALEKEVPGSGLDWPFADVVGVVSRGKTYLVYWQGKPEPILSWPHQPLYLSFSAQQNYLFINALRPGRNRQNLVNLKAPTKALEIELRGDIKQVVFSEDEKYFLVLTENGNLTVWSTAGEQLFSWQDNRFMNVIAAGFSQDGAYLRVLGELMEKGLHVTEKHSYQYASIESPISPEIFVKDLSPVINKWELSEAEKEALGLPFERTIKPLGK
jgi:hypothetical protein